MKWRARLPRLALGSFVAATYAFLYAPAIVIMVYSFNSSSVMSWPLDGFSTQWYSKAFADAEMIGALQNSAIVAVTSTLIALVLGVPAGYALDRWDFPGKNAFGRVLMAPFLFPGVISGVMLVTLFIDLGVDLSLGTVIVGHATMLLGLFVILTTISLSRWDRSLESAAMDLGASEVKTFFLITLPNLKNVIVGGTLLGLTVSLDEVARTFFLTGSENTLPMVVMSKLHLQVTPEVNAMATLVLTTSLVALGLWSWLFRPRGITR